MEKIPQTSHEPQTPELATSPELSEQVANAAAAIGGVGAVAVGHEITPPAEPNPQGFIGRRWQGLKKAMRGFDLRNSSAGQAAIESGVEFSKWDVAKAAIYEAGLTLPQVGRVAAGVVNEALGGRSQEKRTYKIARANAGLANPLMRKKLAEGLLQKTVANNPAYIHIAKTPILAGDLGTRRVIRNKLHQEANSKAKRMQSRDRRRQQIHGSR
ncbi:MAG TPA: hypothetical protein VF401_02300 [Candidatus Saccharimonadales bacterium]